MFAILFVIFIFGLIFGSFLNVVIYRLPLGQDIVRGHSHCPGCSKTLRWRELIPVISFFLLGGKCSGCKVKISWQYPLVEFMSGFLWVLVFYKVFGGFEFGIWDLFGNWKLEIGNSGIGLFNMIIFIYQVIILSSLIVISAIDARHMIIPDKIVYPAAIVALIYNFAASIIFNDFGTNLAGPLLAGGILFLFFFSLFYFSKGRAMGLGDAKMGILLGFFLGFNQSLVSLFWAFVLGALFGIILIVLGRKKFSSQVPFGPFLSLGTLIAYLMPWTGFLYFMESVLIRFY